MHLIFSTFHFIYLNSFPSRKLILLLYYASLVGALRFVRCPVSSGLNVCLIQSREAAGVRPPQPPFEMRGHFNQTEKTGGLSPFISIKYLTAKYIYHGLQDIQCLHARASVPVVCVLAFLFLQNIIHGQRRALTSVMTPAAVQFREVQRQETSCCGITI